MRGGNPELAGGPVEEDNCSPHHPQILAEYLHGLFEEGTGIKGRGRGLTHAQYLTALVDLHARIRGAADGGDEAARAALDELGLQTVAV